ncbi:MAG: response regulator transcription factor [Chloroflexota bacterium]
MNLPTRSAPQPTLRVLIIDGHPATGRGLKALVSEMPGVQVIGLSTRGERGLAQAAEAVPDVALVDAELPGLCSAAVIKLLRARLPKTRIIALGIYPERRQSALDAGAHEFVLKDAGYDALRAAIGNGATTFGDEAAAQASDRANATDAEGPARHTVVRPVGPAAHGKKVAS